jgi:hypothetical protein
MADVKTISGVPEHMLNILYQRASSGLDWGLCLAVMEQVLWQFLVETKEIMLLLISKSSKRNAGNKNIFLMLIFQRSLRF